MHTHQSMRGDSTTASRADAHPGIAGLLVAAFVCALFAAAASWALFVQLRRAGLQEDNGFFLRLFLKAALFTIAAGVLPFALKWLRYAPPAGAGQPRTPDSGAYLRILQGLAALVAVLLVFPHLRAYPWTGPDELHHLIVSKNLAESGVYASGHPATGLRYFDPYDSVGAPVIAPIALAFRVAHTDYVYGRLLIACFYLALCTGVYFLFAPAFGRAAAATAVLLMTTAFGTVYFARSVYGEVPALAFFVFGLILWRAALAAPRPVPASLAAGVCFGLAVLTKAFMLVAACPFLGVFIFDRMHGKTIRWRPNLWTAAGLVATIMFWAAIESAFGPPAAESPSMLVYYRHYLMFGLEESAAGWRWLLGQPVSFALGLAAFAIGGRALLRERYDPALLVLLLTALLFAFWWVFFTPGNIPRYMWYSAAIAGMFAGVVLERMRAVLAERRLPVPQRAAATALIFALLATGFHRVAPEVEKVYGHDQMVGELEMANYVRSLPANTRIATTYWAAARSVTFFTGKPLDIVDDPECARAQYDVIIMDSYTETVPPRLALNAPRVGRYLIVSDSAPNNGDRTNVR